MKIAVFEPKFLTPKPFAASHLILLRSQIKGLGRLGNDIVVLAEDYYDIQPPEVCDNVTTCILRGKLTSLGSSLTPTSQRISGFADFFSPDIILKATRALGRESPDVIYTCGSPFFGIFSAALGIMTGIPTVHYVFTPIRSHMWWRGETFEGYDKPMTGVIREFLKQTLRELPARPSLVKWGLEHITQLIASSKYIRNSLRELGLNVGDIPVVYPGVEIPQLVKAGDANEQIITYYGHFRPRRGIMDLMQAFFHLARSFPETKLMLAISNIHDVYGSTVVRQFEGQISSYGLNSRILWRGVVRDVYLEVLVPSTIIVLPQHDPSIKILESMAAAKPLVTTRVEWTPELICDGANGYLVNVGDVEGIVNKVGILLADARLAEEMGRNARRTIKEMCDLNEKAKDISDILRLGVKAIA